MGSNLKYKFIKSSKLFKNLSEDELKDLYKNPNLEFAEYKKSQILFNALDTPKYLFILGDGAVKVEKNDIHGKKVIVNLFKNSGTVFGEVYLYLEDRAYDYSCVAMKDTRVLKMPRDFLISLGDLKKPYYKTLVDNMLEILASKAYHLNQKLLILGSYTLRQKIANYIIQFADEDDSVYLKFNRQELSEYIGSTRPSLSRELMAMVDEKIIEVKKDKIKILDRSYLEDII
ncbi:MAG: Crp/Fnr family transcriptional regulator [Tissierellia bacterium]|nr:Crp/Fnr family transcriptional regulator [Tissierellia bacterium]